MKIVTFSRWSVKGRREGNILVMQKLFYFSTGMSQLEMNMYATNTEKLDVCWYKEFTV